MNDFVLPAEWVRQSGVMITWPEAHTDWCDILDEATECYTRIAHEIVKHEPLLVVCRDSKDVREKLSDVLEKVIIYEMETNDTWMRDYGPISLYVEGSPTIFDFQFNAWGLKFAANYDNRITKKLYDRGAFTLQTTYGSFLHCVLEGGSIDSDGEGTLLTTSECLLSENRNEYMPKEAIEERLKEYLGLKRILWVDNGYLAGDDTDSHIDTLARFCNRDTIAYVKCTDPTDEHYEELKLMEQQLQSFKTLEEKPYNLIPLPLPTAQYDDSLETVAKNGKPMRLPATYANFLIVNGAVLVPTYQCKEDACAIKQLEKVFAPEREVVGIDCSILIRQHGSLHCCTMQLPEGFLNITK